MMRKKNRSTKKKKKIKLDPELVKLLEDEQLITYK